MNWIKNNQKVVFFSFITVIVGITVLSLMPPISKINLSEKDKIGHFVAYTVLTLNGLIIQKYQSKKFWMLFAFILYGGLMEFLQGFVPGREVSAWDLVANTNGVLIGFALIQLFEKANNKL
jgi:VanZ family protein